MPNLKEGGKEVGEMKNKEGGEEGRTLWGRKEYVRGEEMKGEMRGKEGKREREKGRRERKRGREWRQRE